MIDPVTSAVIRSGLRAAAREMFSVFKRTATLPVLYEFNDFGLSVYDHRLNLVADAPGFPIFAGSLGLCLERTLNEIGGRDALRPGDILLNNHPYLTAGQPPDAALMEPVFYGDELIGFSALRAHMGDLGAKTPYPSDSTDLFQEGILFPALKLYQEGTLNDAIPKIIAANSRLPRETVGNFLAGAGALRACSRKVRALVAKYGRETYDHAIDDLLDQGEAVTRAALRRVPDGTYVVVDLMDDNGVDDDPVELRCEVTVADDAVTIDLHGSAPEQRGPINCPWGYTLTTCRFALKRLMTPELPVSSGEWRPISVLAPEGSIFDPRPPAPCFISGWTSIRLSDMVVRAFAQAMPESVPADNAGDIVNLIAFLRSPGSGRWCFFNDLGALGHGASKGHDGMNALAHPVVAGMENLPTELVEARMPVLRRRLELNCDSGGAGEFRGGLSATSEFEFLSDGIAIVVTEKSRASAPVGAEGGMPPPAKNVVVLFPGEEREMRLGKRSDVPIREGDVACSIPAGGAGFGDPRRRDPRRVAWDVLNEYVSLERARDVYGVVVDETTGDVDEKQTQELRSM